MMDVHERMLTSPFLLILFLSSPICFLSFYPAAAAVDDDQPIMDAMAKSLTSLPTGWSAGTNYCNWSSVRCDRNNRVTEINLSSKSLSGTLPPTLNSLSQLRSLYLDSNRLSGPLPSFANLTLLQSLLLDSNKFTSVPPGAFSGLDSLQTLTLSENVDLSPWPFPSEIADSPSIETIFASNANIFGSLPDIFASLSSLKSLTLSYNNLTGSLPGSLNMTLMQILWLNNQKSGLTGSIDVLSGMTQLTQVWLHANRFTGPIPDLSGCKQLIDIQLRDNHLTGVVPHSLSSLPYLANITLQNNKFLGPLPDFSSNTQVTLGSTNSFCRDVPGDCDTQVTTLLEIAAALKYPMVLAKSWTGNNACKQWTFVTCGSSGLVVITINFAKQGFSGSISPAFSNLTSLRELHLNDNHLTGTIPVHLTTLTQLQEIDVSNNNLSGQVPGFRPDVLVLTTGNKNIKSNLLSPSGSPTIGSPLSATPSGSPGTAFHHSANKGAIGKKLKIMLAIFLPTICTLVLLIILNVYRMRERAVQVQKDAENWGDLSKISPDSPVIFISEVLQRATNNFDVERKLGPGGFGSVFEGTLSDGTKVAVKRLDHHGQGRKEFLAEVQTIGSIHHFNLVKLVGYCADKLNRLLVYEYMTNGSLDKWIFNPGSRNPLSWNAKKKIILHVARGLAYLHEECRKRIAHLDVKPQNVLLDTDFNAKLSDFGLAKMIDRDRSFVMTQMRGTRGYLAPEWLGGRITEKADIYSFGVVVLEVVFERKSFDCSNPDESTLFIHLVKNKADEGNLSEVMDQCCQEMKQNGEDIEKTVKLAIWCLNTDPARRPPMSTVVKILEDAATLEASYDYHLTVLETEAKLADMPMTQLSASILSGPR